MLTRMSGSPNSDPRAHVSAEGPGEDLGGAGEEGPGVLAGLPRTRPQRASARRAAARAPSSHKAPAKTSRKAPTKQARANRPTVESVPVQGYEPEGDSLSRPIQPPGGAELAASIAELVGELAKAGVNTGARLLKDFFSHLPPG
jgi:hypothetical protein